jgi:hypothetical protein
MLIHAELLKKPKNRACVGDRLVDGQGNLKFLGTRSLRDIPREVSWVTRSPFNYPVPMLQNKQAEGGRRRTGDPFKRGRPWLPGFDDDIASGAV